MNKKTQAILIAFIILMLILIAAEYNRQFKSDFNALNQETQVLQARVDMAQLKIDELKTKVYVVKTELDLQRETTDQSNYQFFIGNRELFEDISHEK